jgi:hypothetical protein
MIKDLQQPAVFETLKILPDHANLDHQRLEMMQQLASPRKQQQQLKPLRAIRMIVTTTRMTWTSTLAHWSLQRVWLPLVFLLRSFFDHDDDERRE